MGDPIGENAWVGDPVLCVGEKYPGESVKIEIPREVKVATQAGIDAYLACERAGIAPDVAVQFAGVAFRAVIEMAENERDRSAQLMKYTLPFQGGVKKVG